MGTGRAISNRNVLAAKFERADFDGRFLATFGRPELRGTWIIYGGSGSGKTALMLELCRYLAGFRRVAVDSLEQGLCLSFQKAWERAGMQEAGDRIVLLDREGPEEVRRRLRKRSSRSPGVVAVDSIHYWRGFGMDDYIALRGEFPDRLFIFTAHERNGLPDGRLAQKIRYDSDVKIRVEGYKAFVTTRYEDPGMGEGGADFIIWKEGAEAYWLKKMQ